MIDIHCHLLPGIDDGPRDEAEALLLAQALVQDGVTHVVCTPHVFPGRYANNRRSIAEAFAAFRRRLLEADIDLGLSFAGEVRLGPEVIALLERDEIPFLGVQSDGRKTMLLELPDGQIPVGADRLVDRLLNHGVRPIIVHPERNRMVMDDPRRMTAFARMGCRMQLTAASLSGHFGPRVQAAARSLLDFGYVHAVATDAHNLGGRKPRMTQAREWLVREYGASKAHQLTSAGPAELAGVAVAQTSAGSL